MTSIDQTLPGPPPREAALDAVCDEVGELLGQQHAATARLVELIARVDADNLWGDAGASSLEHWIAWQCGVSPSRARALAALARRADELPETMSRLARGTVSEDQATAIARRAPAGTDAHFAELAEEATVSQLRRALHLTTRPAPRPAGDEPAPEPAPDDARPWASAHFDDEGGWHLRATLPATDGAVADSALAAHLDALVQEWKAQKAELERRGLDASAMAPFPTLGDALVRLLERGLDAEAAARPHVDRTTVVLHVDVESTSASLHLGPALSDAERRYLGCDARWRVLYERAGQPLGIGRESRKIPRWLRRAIEHRDQHCRVPGCAATKGLHLHHIRHWEDGGPTEVWNLVLLCPYHHRLHHGGLITISGTADDLRVVGRRGRPMSSGGLARPPSSSPVPAQPFEPPTDRRAEWRWYDPPDPSRSN